MSLADSPVPSSSSDDLAAFLDAELDTTSDASVDTEEAEEEEHSDDGDEDNYDVDFQRVKRRKVEFSEDVINPQSSSSQGELPAVLGSLPKKNWCPHPGDIAGMCVRCGQEIVNESGVTLGYIHEKLRFSNDEMARVRNIDLKNLLRNKKLYLVLDLDHTLLNSARLADITVEEGYLNGQRDALPGDCQIWMPCKITLDIQLSLEQLNIGGQRTVGHLF